MANTIPAPPPIEQKNVLFKKISILSEKVKK